MGVILDPRAENPRPADLQQPDPYIFNQIRSFRVDLVVGLRSARAFVWQRCGNRFGISLSPVCVRFAHVSMVALFKQLQCALEPKRCRSQIA